ncbi:UNVERIFIED_CONTAM: hypothetical protein Sradi_3293500 [Sesamum radiatum]|uniref:Reverse transcriptase Ty1/copia-type domain-containing protein n=1 Tax=Sesamum radiatum TaxID=300843 RepID=A0AAW2R1W6_SESRA
MYRKIASVWISAIFPCHCLLTMVTNNVQMSFLVFVDDILITRPSLYDIQAVKDHLHAFFTIKDVGDACYFLRLEIACNPSGAYLAQTKYVLDIVKDAKLLRSKAASMPFPQSLKLTADCGARLEHPDAYCRLVGRLLSQLHQTRYFALCATAQSIFYTSL